VGSYIRDLEQKVNEELGGSLLVSLDEALSIKEGLSSGSFLLNNALSGSPLIGYAWGRIGEIFGPEQSGKTTLTLHAIREAQRLKLPCAFIDAEHALDVQYAAAIGVDVKNLSVNQPDCGEDAIEVVKACVLAGYKLIVVDSVAALTPRAEIEGNIGDAHMAKQARLMGQSLRVLSGMNSKAGSIILFINQLRMKVGVIFGSPETTPGGKALKFWSTYRLDIRAPRAGAKKEKSLLGDSVETGIDSKVKVIKNKVFPPHRMALLRIRYGEGIDRRHDLLSYLQHSQLFVNHRKRNVISVGKKLMTIRQLSNALDKDDVVLKKSVLKLLKTIDARGLDEVRAIMVQSVKRRK